MLQVDFGPKAFQGQGMAGNDPLRRQTFNKVRRRQPSLRQCRGEKVGQPKVNCMAVDRVASDESRNRRNPEHCLVYGVGNKGADEMNWIGFVAGEREEGKVVRSRDRRFVDDGVGAQNTLPGDDL